LVVENKKISEKNDSMLELLDDVGRKLRKRRPIPHPMKRRLPPQQKKQQPLKV